jgi:hypothetical protein
MKYKDITLHKSNIVVTSNLECGDNSKNAQNVSSRILLSVSPGSKRNTSPVDRPCPADPD